MCGAGGRSRSSLNTFLLIAAAAVSSNGARVHDAAGGAYYSLPELSVR
jgi:hypothetical protein